MNYDAMTAKLKRDKAIIQAHQEGRTYDQICAELGISHYTVRKALRPESVATKPSLARKLPPDWEGIVCAIGETAPGRMYCAAMCDGERCAEPASKAMLEQFREYDAQRRRHNHHCSEEEARYRNRRTVPGNEEDVRRMIG